MKKFLIGVIFLIPVIVVLALNATGAIIQSTTPVNPTDIIVKNSDNVELKRGDIVKVDIEEKNEFLIFEVLPGITKDKTVTYEIDEDAGDGRVKLERIGKTNKYSVIPKEVGICKLDVRATANVNIAKEVTINVTTDTINDVNIYDANGDAIEKNLKLTGRTRLIADIYPIDALVSATWRSEDDSVATVNSNGVVTPVGHGATTIVLDMRDKDANYLSKKIEIDTYSCVARTERVYISKSDGITSDWVLQNIALSPAYTKVKLIEEQATFNRFELRYEREGEDALVSDVTVVKCDKGAVGFTDGLDTVYTNNGPYTTGIAYLETGKSVSGVTYVSSAPDVLEVSSDGALTPLKAGIATITATYGGGSVDKEYTVKERPVTFELALGTADAKRGIQLKRTWGLYWLTEAEDGALKPWGAGKCYNLTSTYNFGLLDDNGTFDVAWSVDNEEYASLTPTGVNNDVDITFKEAVAGNSVTVTATLVVDNRKVERVSRSFKFSFQSKVKSVNLYDYEQMKAAINAQEYDLVFQNDIVATCTYGLFSSIYGNGFTFDYAELSARENQWTYWRVLSPKVMYEYNDTYDHHNNISEGKFIIEDVAIKGANSVEEATNTGGMIEFHTMETPIEIRYCQVFNTTEGITINRCKQVLVEGCIFGDNYLSSFSLGYSSEYDYEGDITLRNNVFKSSGGAAVQLYLDITNSETINKPMKANINVEGFMDVYNWKESTEIAEIVTKTMFVRLRLDDNVQDLLMKAASGVVKEIIGGSAFENAYYRYNNKQYVSFGIFGIGLMATADVNRVRIDESAQMKAFSVPLSESDALTAVEGVVTKFISGAPAGLKLSNDCYIVCTDFTKGAPYIEPGDPVPNSKDLYYDLVNGRNA